MNKQELKEMERLNMLLDAMRANKDTIALLEDKITDCKNQEMEYRNSIENLYYTMKNYNVSDYYMKKNVDPKNKYKLAYLLRIMKGKENAKKRA